MTVKTVNNSNRLIIVRHEKGEVRIDLAWKSESCNFVIQTTALNNVSRKQLKEFSEALVLACKHLGSKIKRTVHVKGTEMDPDEPLEVPGKDLKVVYQIYENDTRHKLYFTKKHTTGLVRATVKSFSWRNDIASAIQLSFVSNSASDLMAQYEK